MRLMIRGISDCCGMPLWSQPSAGNHDEAPGYPAGWSVFSGSAKVVIIVPNRPQKVPFQRGRGLSGGGGLAAD